MKDEKVVVIYSGGMDSFTLLHEVYDEYTDGVHALSFNYGQRHAKELDYAKTVTDILGIQHEIVDMANLGNQLLKGSSQTQFNIPVPEGHYEDENMKLTVVPNRNMIMLSLAIGYAISIGAKKVFYGAHAGDHAIYPDCRPDFVKVMQLVANLAHYEPIEILAPYLFIDKGDIAIKGKAMNLDYSLTWTCYNGREKACGKCGACQERLEAMSKAGLDDTVFLDYEEIE